MKWTHYAIALTLLGLAVVLGLQMSRAINAPAYTVKVLSITGTTIAAPLEVAGVEYTEAVYVPGQHNIPSFTLTLKNVKAAPHLVDVYATLAKRQRVEIYDNADMLGDPVFAGVLIRPTRDLQGNLQWQGARYEDWLDRRNLRMYQLLSGNAATVAQSLLKTYQSVFSDDFSGNSFTPNWTFTSGGTGAGWSYVSDGSGGYYIEKVGTSVASGSLRTASTYAGTQWQNAKISFDYKLSTANSGCALYFYLFETTGNGFALEIYNSDTNNAWIATSDQQLTLTTQTRQMVVPINYWHHVDVYLTPTTATIDIDGIEAIVDTRMAFGASNTAYIAFSRQFATYASYIDNFIFATSTSVLVPGTVDTSTTTLSQQMNGDAQLSALEWIAEREGWEYRITPKQGAGNDVIDIGASVGRDWSSVMTLQEGENIINLNSDDSSDGLATWLNTYGQSRNDTTSSFINVNISAMASYGILESQYNDERIIDSATAKAVGDVKLSRLAAGNTSIQGRIIDEAYLYAQNPKWGYAVWGDAVAGGRPDKLHAGDLVYLKSPTVNVDKVCEIVSLTRKSGDPAVDVVFDWHRYSQRNEGRKLKRTVELLQRSLYQSIDTQTLVFALTGTTAQSLSFNIKGMLYKTVYMDVTSAAWAGTVTLAVYKDGSLIGTANYTADASGDVSSFMGNAGTYKITATPTSTVTVSVAIRPVLMG